MNAATDIAAPTGARPSTKAAWICLAIAWITFLVPIPGIGLFIGWPLNLVAFILGIVAMTKGRTRGGLIPLLASLIVSPIVYFIGVAILAGAATGLNKDALDKAAAQANAASASTTTEAEPAPAAPAADALKVSASQLYADYDANEVAADSKYKGKALVVTGTVESINKDITDGVYVALQGSDFNTVQAHDLDATKAAALSKGQQVTVACTGNGMILGSPLLKDCSLQ